MKIRYVLLLALSLMLVASIASAQRWEQVEGKATDIGIGADGTVWISGVEGNNYSVSKWAEGEWIPIVGGAARIDVGPDGLPYAVNPKNGLGKFTDKGTWSEYPRYASDVGVGADGTLWMIGSESENYSVARWSTEDSEWINIVGEPRRIDVGPDGTPYVVNENGTVFFYNGVKWIEMPGKLTDISVGADGTIWGVGTNKQDNGSGFGIWKYVDGEWIAFAGTAVNISVGPDGKPWLVNARNEIWRMK